jgi:uncharacterized protein YoxC
MSEKINIIIAAQTNAAVKGLDQVSKSTQRVGESVQNAQSKMGNFNKSVTAGNVNLRKFAMGGLQQTGYQVGDFAVQVANGTSKMQAFGQQAPQLLQIFGPFGAILGAGVAIFAAFGVAIQKAGGNFLDFTTALDKGKDALSSSKKQTKGYREELALLASGLKTVEQLELQRAANAVRTEIAQRRARLEEQKGQKGRNNTSRLIGIEIKARENLLESIEKQLLVSRAFEKSLEGPITAAERFKDVIFDPRAPNYDPIVAEFARVSLAIDDASSKSDKLTKGVDRVALAVAKANKKGRKFEDWVFDVRDARFDPVIAEFARLQMGIDNANDSGEKLSKNVNKIANIMGQVRQKNEIIFDPRDPRYDAMRVKMFQISEEAENVGKSGDSASSGFKKLSKTINNDLSPELIRLQSVQNAVSASFENGFMSMVDGTESVKSAFRSMAAEIIKELYRIFVVKQITGFITSAIGGYFNANQVSGPSMPLGTGNVRPQARTFAGGGYTGNGPRAGGLDGKGGFMAMLHPRETVTDHTKGSGGGQVVVNQTINVSTGVQQTVRTEIRTLMPQIANAAKAAVVDAKRRGGSYGKAFS